MDDIEPSEVQISAVHDIEAAGLKRDPIEQCEIGRVSLGNVYEARYRAAKVEHGVQLHCRLIALEPRPRKKRQAHVDDGRVERVCRIRQFDAEAISRIELSCDVDEAQSEVLINAPVTFLVGIRERAACHAAPNAEVIQLRGVSSQTRFDIAQALAKRKLRKRHAQKLIEVRELERRISARISRYAPPKCMQRQVIHQLREHEFAVMHQQLLAKAKSLSRIQIGDTP